MATENQTKQAEAITDATASETVTREEFAKVAQLADALGANLRKEREAAAKRASSLEEQLRSVAETLASLKQPVDGDGKKPDEAQAKYEARIKEMEAKLDAERKAREQEASARLVQERRTALSNALASKGVTGPHLRAAIAFIDDSQRLVVHDDKGQVGIRFERAGYDDVVPIDQGVDELLKHPDYQIFMPPRQAAGGGTVPGAAKRPGPHKMTKEEAMRMLIPAVLKASH